MEIENFLKYCLLQEENLIKDNLKKIKNTTIKSNEIKTKEDSINEFLKLSDDSNPAYKVHKKYIFNLISIYCKIKFKENSSQIVRILNIEESTLIDEYIITNYEKIPDTIEQLHINYLNSIFNIENGVITRKKSKLYSREFGATYTSEITSKQIVETTINNLSKKLIDSNKFKCLDFACGSGRFYFQAISIIKKKFNLTYKEIICNNLYAVDIDEIAIMALKCKIISMFPHIDDEISRALNNNVIIRNALIPETIMFNDFANTLNFERDFCDVFKEGGFDAVFSNPPYFLLKTNSNQNEGLNSKINKEANYFRNSDFYYHSTEGTLNYYKLSIEMILHLTKNNGEIGIICPSTIFGDLTSTKLRKYLLNKNKINSISYFSESAKLFDNVTQSTVILFLTKGNTTTEINVNLGEENFGLNYSNIKNIFITNYELPLIKKLEWEILIKIHKNKKIKDFKFLRNKRGEFDLTFFKNLIVKENTGWRLVRGNMIQQSELINLNQEFVNIEEFIKLKSQEYKDYDFNKKRLICQQISNIDKKNRLNFVFCNNTDILANSCNYIQSTRDEEDLIKIHTLLNSKLLNWRFKITSSNNHINNYEIDELPLIDIDQIESNELFEINDEEICKLYGLNQIETNYILNL